MAIKMRSLLLVSTALSLLHCTAASNGTFQTRSSKRGLVYVPSSEYPNDDKIWYSDDSDLSWYYNYQYYPSAAYENVSSLEFVPMLWGAPASTTDNTFLNNVTAQILSGANITYVMSFNEPDGTSATGGSDIAPELAATTWIREIQPLRRLGVKVGAPAVTGGSSGFTWLTNFFEACNGSCTADFIPVHWYGDFDGMASHIGEVTSVYPDLKIWVTEFALTDSALNVTQSYFNESCEYFDSLSNITRYSYFGAFRSDVSNIGYNATFLTSAGLLTDIGSWYLGGSATGNIPDNVTVTVASNATATAAATARFTGWDIPVAMAAGRPSAMGAVGVGLGVAGLVALL